MNNAYRGRAGAKAILVLLSVFILLILLSSAVSAQMLGDVNFDGVIDIRDVILVQRHILGYLPPLNTAQLTAADVNGDGIVNVIDAYLIMQYIQGYIDSFPIHHLYGPVLISPVEGSSIDGTMVSFHWGVVTGATRYQLEITRVSDGSIFRTVDLGNYTSTTQYAFANDGTQYRWRVRGGNSTHWGSWSGYRTFTNGTIPVLVSTVLSAPTLTLPADNATAAGTSITFQWAAVSGANKYELEVTRASDNAVYKNQVLENITSSTQVGFLNDGIRYRWRVRAGNDAGWGYWSVYRTFANGLPAAPVLLLPAANANEAISSITFEWTLSSGANRYKLELRNNATSALVRTVELGNVSATILDGFPSDGTQYKWRVQAGNDAGWIETAWSGYRILNNGILPAPPVLVSPENNGNVAGSSIFFRWNPSTGATKYEIKVSKGVNIFKTQALGYTTSVILDGFLNDGTEYEWCVRAGNISGWGNWSDCRTLANGAPIAAPVLVSPADNANSKSTSVMFEWKITNGADNYELKIIDSEDNIYRTISLGSATASIQHDLLNNAHFRWQVRGGNDDKWSDWSGTRNLIVGNLLSAPALISPAEAVYKATESVLADNYEINFKWAASSGADKYEFEVIRVRDGSVFGSQVLGKVTTYAQTGFTNDGAEYKWRVRAGKNIGTGTSATVGWGAWSAYRHFVNQDPESNLAAPVQVLPAVDSLVQGTSIEFSWSDSNTPDKYHLQVVRVTDGKVVIDGPVGNGKASTQAGFPNDGSEFMWRVRAGEADGADFKWGAWSFYSTFTNGFWWLNLF